MGKLGLIVKREYLTRVQKPTFILATLLTPLAFGLLIFVSGYMTSSSMKSQKKVLITDQSGVLKSEDLESSSISYELSNESLDEAKKSYIENGYDVLVNIPEFSDLKSKKHKASFYTEEKLSLVTLERIEDKLSDQFKNYKIEQSDISKTQLEDLKINIVMENASMTDKEASGDKSSRMSVIISTGLSYMMGFLMYMVIFIYGGMVMRSVMEEKINRIVEVMISSVKPFQLMLGKVIGVGMVGLTQLAIWLILIPAILFLTSSVMGLENATSPEAQEMMSQMEKSSDNFSAANLIAEIKAMNWGMIIPVFVIFFLGGYFIYSSLFAAVGSAIGDDLGEGQQLMMPIIVPVIIALVMVPAVFNDPNGSISVFGSMFPLFSPIIMPARLPFDPPMWQVLISIVILVATVIFMIWLAGRIYRIGILMYGKKVSFKEIGKWLFYKG